MWNQSVKKKKRYFNSSFLFRWKKKSSWPAAISDKLPNKKCDLQLKNITIVPKFQLQAFTINSY